MKRFALESNEQLFSYLTGLADELQRVGEVAAAERVKFASKFVSGSPSEFLHESQAALKSVRSECAGKLSQPQTEVIASVILQIEDAFRQVGGA